MARPAFKVTAAMRRDVELMKADGFSDDRIARQLRCTRPTLLKHFAEELEFGADRVRREQLANLRRASKKGNVAAAKALLNRADLVPPPGAPAPSPTPEKADDAKGVKLGKKEAANLEAQTAEEGTSWQGLLKH